VPSFILRNLDPEFWQRVQLKAAAEGTTVKALILRLLSSWLAAAVVVLMIGCAEKLPTSPSTLVGQPQAGVPARLELNASPGIGAQGGTGTITARVVDGLAGNVPGVTVTFTVSDGTLDASSAVSDGNGLAKVSITGPTGVVQVTASTGTLQSKTQLAIQPVPPPAIPVTPFPAPQPPPPAPQPTPPPPPPPVTLSVVLDCSDSVAVGAPINCTAAVTNTVSTDTLIVAYQWDLDGVSGFDFTTTGPSKTSDNQTKNGLFTATVKVTTAGGRTATGSTGFVVTN